MRSILFVVLRQNHIRLKTIDIFHCRTSPLTPCSRSLVRCFVFSFRPLTSEISPGRISPFVNSWQCSSARARGLGRGRRIASFGCGCPRVGRIGTERWSSSGQRPS